MARGNRAQGQPAHGQNPAALAGCLSTGYAVEGHQPGQARSAGERQESRRGSECHDQPDAGSGAVHPAAGDARMGMVGQHAESAAVARNPSGGFAF